MPSRLSSVATSWLASGVTRYVTPACVRSCSSFLPIFAQLRPANDISKSLRGGPTDWEARLENVILTGCAAFSGSSSSMSGLIWPLLAPWRLPPLGPGLPGSIKICRVGSEGPNTLPPLKLKRARPSQKLSKLNAAPWKVGVWRGSTLRKPWFAVTGSSSSVPMSGFSAATPFAAGMNAPAPGTGMSTNALNLLTPMDDRTSLESLVVTDPVQAGTKPSDTPQFVAPSPAASGLRFWNGKSLATTSMFGPLICSGRSVPPKVFGLS